MQDADQAARIGERVRELREYRAIFQHSFAEKCGTSQQYMSALERGEKLPTIRQLLRIASVLNCKLDIVLTPLDRHGNEILYTSESLRRAIKD